MNHVIDIFHDHYGYARLKDLKVNRIHTDTIKKLLDDNIIEKVKPGLYKLVDMPVTAEQGMIDIHMAMPQAVVCLHSALAWYDLTTTTPSEIMIALPRGSKPVKLAYPPVNVYYFSSENYQAGIQHIETGAGAYAIYNAEKSIVDSFRYRNKLGEDVALESLKNYLARPDYQINTLLDFARKGRMYNILKPYIEAYLTT